MSRTIRVYWGGRATGWHNFNWTGVITFKSVVHISVSEGSINRGLFNPLDGISHTRGDAVIGVRNINPHENGVEFYLEVGWNHPLDIVLDITVLDPPELGFVVN